MIAGDSKPKILILEASNGTAQSFASKAAFQAAGWDLIWRDVDGTALASQPTWTLSDEGSGRHRVKYTVPAGIYWVEPTIPAGYVMSPEAWANEGQSYDDDALAGLLQTSQGVPAIISADDGTLGDVVMGDSWTSDTLTIALGKLTRHGVAFADLASGWTISAGFRTAAGVPATAVLSGAPAGNGITAEFVVAASGTYRAKWTTYPTAMDLAATADAVQWFMDVQIKRTSDSLIITVARFALRVVWQRDTTV
ncbi:hypothetical protein [Methylibium sp.]|uniref:hypothetical protein n=1 Tax=Methylibium sp. TaxID=2067992 RepID=UPI0017FD370F|nr:hypothetical protein [Methylibium sp.]MBA3589956.1 hypothetical protein [Methylibium sp.]